jgi:hypothetical protein
VYKISSLLLIILCLCTAHLGAKEVIQVGIGTQDTTINCAAGGPVVRDPEFFRSEHRGAQGKNYLRAFRFDRPCILASRGSEPGMGSQRFLATRAEPLSSTVLEGKRRGQR